MEPKTKICESPLDLKDYQFRVANNTVSKYLDSRFKRVGGTHDDNHKYGFLAQPNLSVCYQQSLGPGFYNTFELTFVEFEEGISDKHIKTIENIVKQAKELSESKAKKLDYLEIPEI